MKNSEIGSFLAGIGATEDIDSSGEIIEIKGIDHSSLLRDGKVHFEHKNDNSSQVIGKIVDCKKILKESDCEHELHKHFWEKARKRPYIYVVAVLFDKMGHQGAMDALAQAKFDQHLDTEKTNGMSWWSIEGSRLNKEGNRIKKCIARDWAYTHRPCNKACVAELLTDEQADKFVPHIAKKKVQDSMKKSMAEETDLKKSGTKYFKQLAGPKKVKMGTKSTRDYSPITTATGEQREGSEIEPKRVFTSMDRAPEKGKVGDRILHGKKTKARSGASIYKDPETWKKEIDTENPLRKAIKSQTMKKSASFKDDVPAGRKDLSHNLEPELREQGYTMHVTPSRQIHSIDIMHNGKRVAGMTTVPHENHKHFGNSLEYGSDMVSQNHKHNEDALKRSYWRGALDHAGDEGKNFHGRSWDHHQPIFRHLKKEGHKRMIGKRNKMWGTQFNFPATDKFEKKAVMEQEDKLQKARVDEGKTPEEKAKARAERHYRSVALLDPKDPKNKKYMRSKKIRQKEWQKDWMKQKTDEPGNREYPRKGHNIRHIHQKGVQTGIGRHGDDGKSVLGNLQEGLTNVNSKHRNPFWDDERHREASKHLINRARKENKEIKPNLPKSEKDTILKSQNEQAMGSYEAIKGHNMHKMPKDEARIYEKAHKEHMKQGHDEISAGYKALDRVADYRKAKLKQKVKNAKNQKPNLPKSEKDAILKSLAEEAWNNFKHKDLLIETIKKKEPELSEAEVIGIAKTFAYIDMKKKEGELEDLFEKSKKGRCWEGYEPTPGKKPYSKGSCQPIKKAKVNQTKSMEKSNPPKSEEMAKNEELKSVIDSKLKGWSISHENKKKLHENAKNIHRKTKNHSLSAELAVNDALDSGHLSYKDEGGKEVVGKRNPEKHGKSSKEYFSKSENDQDLHKKEKPFHNYNPSKHSKEGGLNDKERKRINREEGSNLKRPVTGKVKAGSKASKRRKSFCARMSGVKGPTSKEGKLTPKGAALKRWKCNKNEEV